MSGARIVAVAIGTLLLWSGGVQAQVRAAATATIQATVVERSVPVSAEGQVGVTVAASQTESCQQSRSASSDAAPQVAPAARRQCPVVELRPGRTSGLPVRRLDHEVVYAESGAAVIRLAY